MTDFSLYLFWFSIVSMSVLSYVGSHYNAKRIDSIVDEVIGLIINSKHLYDILVKHNLLCEYIKSKLTLKKNTYGTAEQNWFWYNCVLSN